MSVVKLKRYLPLPPKGTPPMQEPINAGKLLAAYESQRTRQSNEEEEQPSFDVNGFRPINMSGVFTPDQMSVHISGSQVSILDEDDNGDVMLRLQSIALERLLQMDSPRLELLIGKLIELAESPFSPYQTEWLQVSAPASSKKERSKSRKSQRWTTAAVSPAAGLALHCLSKAAERDRQNANANPNENPLPALFARIVCCHPAKIGAQVFSAQNSFNILSSTTLLQLLRHSAPAEWTPEQNPHIYLRHQELSGMALRHYLRFPPLARLRPSLSKAMQWQHRSVSESRDLLLQNSALFLKEVARLLIKAISRPRDEAETLHQRAWQASTIIGHSFRLMEQFASEIARDKKKLRAKVEALFDISKTMLGGASSPAPGGSAAVTATLTIGGYVAQKLVETRRDSNLFENFKWLADALKLLSELLKARCAAGTMRIGYGDISEGTAVDQSELQSGEEFVNSYRKSLGFFRQTTLQKGLLRAAVLCQD